MRRAELPHFRISACGMLLLPHLCRTLYSCSPHPVLTHSLSCFSTLLAVASLVTQLPFKSLYLLPVSSSSSFLQSQVYAMKGSTNDSVGLITFMMFTFFFFQLFSHFFLLSLLSFSFLLYLQCLV